MSYAIIRSGIVEHLLSGKLSLFDLGIYTVVHLQADFKTGIWRGSAPRILATSPVGTSLRAVQRGLETLNDIRFLRSFHQRGVRGNYPVLIDKYDVRIGALKGMRLNAWKSESCEKPAYELVAESVAVPVAVRVACSVFSRQEPVKTNGAKGVNHVDANRNGKSNTDPNERAKQRRAAGFAHS